MGNVDRLGWAVSSTFHIGDYHIGVRSSRTEVDAVVRQLLAAYLVDGIEAPANLSVRIGGHGEEPEADSGGKRRSDRGKQLHLLYRSSSLAARSRLPSRILQALVCYLDGLGGHGPRGVLRTSMLALVADGHAIVVPRALLGSLEALQPRLERQGLRFIDAPYADVDPTTAELVIDSPGLTVDEAALTALDRHFGSPGRAEPPVGAGRFPIRGWAIFGGPEETGPVSRAKAVAAVAGSVALDGWEAQDVLEAFVTIFDAVSPVAIWYSRPQEAVEPLIRLAGG
jgi:hypothetical protein